VYNGIFGGLLVLTVVTVWIAQFDFGAANTFIAMFVATIKASLVAFFFMHLLHDERLNLITFGFGLLFVSLFFLFPLLDITSRTYVDPIKDNSSGSKYEKVLKAQKDHEKKHADQLSNFSMFRKSGFVLPSTDEKEATPAPVVAPIEGTPTEGTPVEGTSPVPVQ
jgi:caa(3)-type oxidase subunit IV